MARGYCDVVVLLFSRRAEARADRGFIAVEQLLARPRYLEGRKAWVPWRLSFFSRGRMHGASTHQRLTTWKIQDHTLIARLPLSSYALLILWRSDRQWLLSLV